MKHNMQKAQASAWSPEARRKREATRAANRAAKDVKGAAVVPVDFPIEAIPERQKYEKRPKVDERVRLAGNLIEVVRLILGGKP